MDAQRHPMTAVRYENPTDQFRLDGRTAIITGVGPGIGELAMLTRCLAKECGPVVRANCICPGTIDPEGAMRPIREPIMGGVPLGRVGRAAEVEGAALFLASSASSYVTGQVIFVDGGRVNTVA